MSTQEQRTYMSANPSTVEPGLDRCRSYVVYLINEHKKKTPAVLHWPPSGPAITISDLTGSGAHEIARQVAALLQGNEPRGAAPWTVFDRQLVEKVLEDHHLPKRLAKLMPEDRRSYLNDVLDELVGLRPPSWVLVPKVIKSILQLAEVGHVILVGRGASFVTARLSNTFHVRLVASLPQRIERVQNQQNLSARQAAKFIAKSDRGRGRYVRAYFHSRIDDDLQYHLVLNTDRLPLAEAADLIAYGAGRYFTRSNAAES
jgi:cytidylate kinase